MKKEEDVFDFESAFAQPRVVLFKVKLRGQLDFQLFILIIYCRFGSRSEVFYFVKRQEILCEVSTKLQW